MTDRHATTGPQAARRSLLIRGSLLAAAGWLGPAVAPARAQPAGPLPGSQPLDPLPGSQASVPPPASPPASTMAALLAGTGRCALLRHATAPGTGDPPQFRLDDCATQRNLSEAGRAEATRAGEQLRAAGLADAPVFSSRWCRCLDTAQGLALGPVIPVEIFDSMFGNRDDPARLASMRDWLRAASGPRPFVVVTHQVNLTALFGGWVEPAEILIARTDGDTPQLIGRFDAAGRARAPGG